MEILLQAILLLCFFFLFHTYWLYPRIMKRLAGELQGEALPFPTVSPPFVSVLMAVYNEEKVIGEKMETLLEQVYPKEQIQFFIGSDHSTDQTNDILQNYAVQDERIHFFPFQNRTGKPGVINKLYEEAIDRRPASSRHILLITDANVMLNADCLANLTRHFGRDDQLAIVDAHMQHIGLQAAGISRSEDQYLTGEVLLKHHEGLVWGTMIGPFGGCYCLRSDYFSPVPANYLVDDFYMAMRAFELGGRAINDLSAVCREAVSHDWREEFRRKARISTGNYQNLRTFRHLWWPPTQPLQFAFFSHKVLRWLGPFFLMMIYLGSGLLWYCNHNYLYRWLFLLLNVFYFALPILDALLRNLGIQWRFIRNIRYFFLMNLALLIGFFRFIKGVKNNVWEPPKRQQLPS